MSDFLSLWASLERPPCGPDSSTTLLDWTLHLREGFPTWKRFLVATEEFENHEYPCPEPCEGQTYCLARLYEVPGLENRLLYCEKRSPLIVPKEDLRTYRFDAAAFNVELARVLRFTPDRNPRIDPMLNTWPLGLRMVDNCLVVLHCVLEWEPEHVEEAVKGWIKEKKSDFLLVTPTPARVSDRVRELLAQHRIEWIVLSDHVDVDENGAFAPLVRKPLHREELAPVAVREESVPYRPGPIQLDLVARPDGFHWIVNGEDRCQAFQREGSLLGRISLILFQQIGKGWVPHTTFINATGWRKAEYFGPSTGGGRMQKQLSQIRRKTGLPVEFNARLGVRFPEHIVNTRNQSKNDFFSTGTE